MAMAISFAIVVFIFLVVSLYWRALPKPLARIPHNAASANRLSGDLPGLLAHYKQTKEIASFSFQQCHRLRSPIIQMFLRPFSRPFIWLNDPRETEDILLRRTREFDRAPSTIAMFKPLVPHASMVKMTNEEFKQQRRLWQDVMSPDFLRTVVAPNVHKPVLDLVELWRLKTKLALNHPFEALDDLELSAFDAIWVAILGSKLNGTRTEIEYLESHSAVPMPQNDDDAIHLPTAPRSTMFQAIAYINGTMERIMRSPFPKYHHWIIRQTPTYKYYDAFKNREILGLVHKARDRFKKLCKLLEEEASEYDACAMDLVLRREIIAERKTAAPLLIAGDLDMRDELGMLLVAGHETTATTLGWAVKLLSQNLEPQSTLRQILQSAFPNSTSRSPPSASEILSNNIPYLDGFLEETLRFANTVPLLVRATTVDTDILGYRVPKGTHVMCNAQFMTEPFDIPEHVRSPSCQAAAKRNRPPFAMHDLGAFKPDRWLERTPQGEQVFQPHALTRLAFSLGVRGCFGKKLAMQSLRITLVLLVLSFDFRPVPPELDSRYGHQKILRPPQQCYVRLRAL